MVNQIGRERVIPGKPNRRFDVTLLINGLPIIQIELKSAMRPANGSTQSDGTIYCREASTAVFSTLQILLP